MAERITMHRNLRRIWFGLFLLIVGTNLLSVGCRVGTAALPELPPVPVLMITTTTVSDGFAGTPYPPPNGMPAQVLTTAGGTPPLTSCTIAGGLLPPGLMVSVNPANMSTCVITGTIPMNATTGTYRFTVRAADSSNPAVSDTQDYTMIVRPGFLLNAFTLGNATVGRTFAALSLPTTGGTVTGDLNVGGCTVTGLPAGTGFTVSRSNTVDATGFRRSCLISGTPTAADIGTRMITITGTDQGVGAVMDSKTVSLTVNDVLMATTPALPAGTVNTAYSQTLVRTGGQTPFTWSITAGPFTAGVGNAGTPCEGLSLAAATGVISGTPRNAGTCGPFTARVDDTATSSTTTNGTFPTTAAGFATQVLSIVVNKANSTTVITSDAPDPSVADQSITVNVSVQGVPSGARTPSGNVTVSDGTVNCVAALTPGNPSTGSCMLTPTTAGAKMLTATYPGDANFNGSMANEPHQVNTRATTTTVMLNPTTVSVNQPSAVTVRVTDVEVNGTASSPGGTITIATGNATDTIAACVLAPVAMSVPPASSCTANVTPTQLGSGTRSITASFAATDNKHTNSNSNGAPQMLTVTARTTTTMVAFGTNPAFIAQGSVVTVTVTDIGPAMGASAPLGTVTLMSSVGTDAFTPAASCMLVAATATSSTCTATITPTNPAGMHTVSATFPSNTIHNTSSGMSNLTVNLRTTTTMVAFGTNPVVVNQGSLITVTVTDTAAGTTSAPVGTVNLMSSVVTDAFTPMGSCTLAAATANSSTCTVTVTAAADGTVHTITATFAGSVNHATSNGSNGLTVNRRATTTAVMLAPTTVIVGQGSTVTVTVTDVAAGGTALPPTGTVMLTSSGTGGFAAACTLAMATASSSTCATTYVPAADGTVHTITATFPTSTVHTTSTSNAMLTVNRRPTTTMIMLAPASVFVGQASMATVTVTDSSGVGTASPPTGTIALMGEAGDMFGICTLAMATATSSTCTASVTPTLLGDGTHTITATFANTTVHATSNAMADLTVTLRTSATTVMVAPASVLVRQGATVTVTVSDTTPIPVMTPPGGTIMIASGNGTDVITACTLAPSGPSSSSCMATLTPTQVGAAGGSGTRSITATYTSTDMVHSGSNSTATPQILMVNPRPTTTMLMAASPVVVNQASTVTVTVTDSSGVGTASSPAGTVMFMTDNATDTISGGGMCTLAAATASTSTCTVMVTPTQLGTGTRMVTGTYTPANNNAVAQVHSGSGPSTTSFTVNPRPTTTMVALSPSTVITTQGSMVTITVTDSSGLGTASAPAGMVSLTGEGGDGFTPAPSCTLAPISGTASNCMVTVTPSQVGDGSHTISAIYTPANNGMAAQVHNTSNGSNNLTVNGRPTTTMVAFTSGTVIVNQTNMVMITVTDNAAGTGTQSAPMGTVALTGEAGDTFAPMASCTLAMASPTSSTCTVMLTPTQVGDGSHTISATFTPATAPQVHATSNGSNNLTVNGRPTTTMLVLSPTLVVVNQGSTATVTVADNAPGTGTQSAPMGTVALTGEAGDTFAPMASCTLAMASPTSSTCTVTVTPTQLGDQLHMIMATYVPSTGPQVHAASGPDVADLTVNPRPTTTAVALSPSTVIVTQSSMLTVTVTDTGAGTQSPPAGTLSVFGETGDAFTSGGMCTLAAATANTSTCTLTVTPFDVGDGMHTMNATYTPTNDGTPTQVYATSLNVPPDDPADRLTVNGRPTTTTLMLSTNTAAAGQMFTATVTVMDNAAGTGTQSPPSGTVMFMSTDAGDIFTGSPCTLTPVAMSMTTSTCSVTVTAGGVAALHTISGTYTPMLAPQVHATSPMGMANYTLQPIALAPFSFTTVTEQRAINTQSIPIFGALGGGTTCMISGAPAGLAATFMAVPNRCDVTGTPADGSAAMYTVTVSVTDASGSDMMSSPLTVVSELVFMTAGGLPDAVQNGPTYTTNIMTSGGQPLRTLTEMTATLNTGACAGLTLTTGGMGNESVTGMPTGTGSCMFTLQVMDTATTSVINGVMGTLSASATVTQAQTINVTAAVNITKPTAANLLLNALRGSAYGGDTFTATGGRGSKSFSITTGNFDCTTGGGTTCTGTSGACTGFVLTKSTGAFAHPTAPSTAGTCTINVQAADTANGSQASGSDTEMNISFFVLNTFTYVADPANNQVNVINTTSDTEVPQIPLTAIGANRGPHSVAVRRDGTRAYVTLETSNQLAVIDTTTNTLVTAATLTLSAACTGPREIAIGVAGNAKDRAYIACTNDVVDIIDVSGASPTVLATPAVGVEAGENPGGIDISLDGSRVFISGEGGDNEFYRITTNASAAAETVTTFSNVLPTGTSSSLHVVVSTNGSVVYVTDTVNDAVYVVDATTPAGASTVSIPLFGGLDPLRLTRDPNTGRVFVGMSTAGQLDPNSGGTGTTTGFLMPIESNASTGSKQITVGANNADRAGGVTTITFANQPFVNGDIISVSGMSTADFDGVYTVANAMTNSFTYAQPGRADNANEDGATITLLFSAGTTAPDGLTAPPDNTKVYAGVSDAVARRNDTSPFGSAGANIALSGGATSTPRGMAPIRVPIP